MEVESERRWRRTEHERSAAQFRVQLSSARLNLISWSLRVFVANGSSNLSLRIYPTIRLVHPPAGRQSERPSSGRESSAKVAQKERKREREREGTRDLTIYYCVSHSWRISRVVRSWRRRWRTRRWVTVSSEKPRLPELPGYTRRACAAGSSRYEQWWRDLRHLESLRICMLYVWRRIWVTLNSDSVLGTLESLKTDLESWKPRESREFFVPSFVCPLLSSTFRFTKIASNIHCVLTWRLIRKTILRNNWQYIF